MTAARRFALVTFTSVALGTTGWLTMGNTGPYPTAAIAGQDHGQGQGQGKGHDKDKHKDKDDDDKDETHPKITAALHALEVARKDLQDAAHDFKGHRVAALRHTEEAIKECNAALAVDKD